MKPSAVVPVLALLAGFAGGWLAKPAPAPVAGAPVRPPARVHPSVPVGPVGPAGELPQPPRMDRSPNDASPLPGDASAGPSPISRDAAKMLRVVEALGLSETQQTDLEKILAETRKAYTGGASTKAISAKETLELVSACGATLEKSLTALLTPEQAAKFAELRQRERDNRIEAKTHRELGQLSEITDLSPAQRDQVLAQLRQATVAELSAIPASYSLMLDSSVLPLGSHAMPEQSILVLSQVADTDGSSDPEASHAKLIAEQRRRLDERLTWLKPILSPAQLAQYQASVAEQHAIHDQMIPPPQ